MNNLYKIIVILLLALLCVIVFYASIKANQTMLKVCPVNAITQKNNIAVIDSMKCINCGRCFIGIPSPYNFNIFPNIKPKEKDNSEVIAKQADTVIVDSDAKNSIKPVNKTDIKPADKAIKGKNSIVKTFFKVKAETCISCQLCISNCPVNAITMQNGKAVIDPEKCIACGICANGNGADFMGCPTSAISKVTEPIKK